jgi:hypothetical protein
MAKYSTPLVGIIAIALTMATAASLLELNRRGRAEFDEVQPDTAMSMPNIRLSIEIFAVRCSQ